MASRWRSITALTLGLGLLLGLTDQLRAAAHRRYESGQRYEDVYYLPPAEWLPVMSLGWDEALADLIWMRGLVYFGEELQQGGNVQHVLEYARAATALDPDFRAVYRWVGTAAIYRPVETRPEHVEEAVEFMQRGAARFPEDGELAWDIGAALVFELVPLLDDPEARDDARERGMPWLLSASRLGAAPEWMSLTNSTLLARLGRTEQAARHLEEMYLATRDPRTRERIAERIRRLRDRTEAEAFMQSVREHERARREHFPYLTPELFLFVGPRPPVDLDGPIRDGLPAALSTPPASPR
ncbi:MAG TPA: hypothetical protein RMH99_24710 [Sandaracinaceae bacterium LLY-WYZ-13_1]|nr:hypothetical protein [Sandaracinaceae bacterium LLY-WYZ-13_1]